jgi:hypothetical protein
MHRITRARRGLLKGSIHLEHDLIEEENAHGFIERGKLGVLVEALEQAYSRMPGNDRPWDQHETMKRNVDAGQAV